MAKNAYNVNIPISIVDNVDVKISDINTEQSNYKEHCLIIILKNQDI